MTSRDVLTLLKGEIIGNNLSEVERILNEHEVIDLITINGSEGNLINTAIERSDVGVLALLLGVRHPIDKCVTAISYEQYVKINSVCDDQGFTPLMKAVILHKFEIVELLLTFGAEVNYYSECCTEAVDLTNNPNILCVLFEHDSKFPVDTKKSKALIDLISKDDGKLKELFLARDEVHESLKGRYLFNLNSISSEIKTAIMRGKYYVNSLGQSLLYSSLINKEFHAWSDLMDQGMEYVSLTEKQYEMYFEKECERALVDILIPLDDCHLWKLAAKSYNPQNMKHWKERNHIVLEYFKHMNGDKITKTLMEAVQDVPGFHIVFDFESTSIERIRSCQSKGVRGITEIDRLKISVAAKKNDQYGFPEIVSNIVHELCHLAVVIIYKNNGLPYKTGDEDRKQLYEAVMDQVRNSEGCDEIIRKVWKYPTGQQGMELIVRVPEMISKYQGSVPDGYSRLKEQADVLLDFYKEHVQPDLGEYVEGFITSRRIMGRGLIEYQELFMEAEGIQVSDSVEKDFMDFIGEHNGLKVAKVSNLKIAQSHLKLSLIRRGMHSPFFIDWSFYHKCRVFIEKCLTTGEIDTLAISWDERTPLSFCKYNQCIGYCPGTYISNFERKMYMLIHSEYRVPIGIKSLKYSWDDLSTETKNIIKEREIEFNGKRVLFKTLISDPGGGYSVDEFYRDRLEPKDINLILDGGNIVIGKPDTLHGCPGDHMVLLQPEMFITRRLTLSFVEFNEDLLRRFENDMFCVGNIELSGLQDLGISESCMKHWEGKSSDIAAQCFVLHPIPHGKNEDSVIKEILDHLYGTKLGNMFHYVKYRQGMFAHVRSFDIQKGVEIVANEVEGLLSSITVERLVEMPTFKTCDPFLLADDPGTGKSTYLHSIAEEIKETHPERWVSLIDLGAPAQQKHFSTVKNKSSFSREEVLDLLFQLIGGGRKDSLERKIFDEFCGKKNKIIIIFDGCDEICPNYKSIMTSFIIALRKAKDDIKLLISTRLHEKLDLEEELGVISHELLAFSQEDQLNFLSDLWNELLNVLLLSDWQEKISTSVSNFERWVGEQNYDDICTVISVMKGMLSDSREKKKYVRKRIDLKPIASKVLLGWQTLFTVPDGFMETPLHLKMISIVIFYDSFDLKKTMNLGHLYQRFFNMKVEIHVQGKAGGSDNVQADSSLWIHQEKVSEILEKISVNLMEVGRTFKMKDREIRTAFNFGLLSQKGGGLQFTHRTFTEFFFAKWALKEAGKSDVTKLWIEFLFVDERFTGVRKFIENMLHLLSEGISDSQERESAEDFLMLEKTKLDESVLKNPSDLQNSIYCIVRECGTYTMEYFEESFGLNVAKVIIENVDPNYCCKGLRDITDRCRRYCSMGTNDFFSAITFAASYFFSNGIKTKDYLKLLGKMLYLVKENGMLGKITQFLLTDRVGVFFLPLFSHAVAPSMHTEDVLSFLLENKETLSDVLREWMTPTSDSNLHSCKIFRGIFILHPDLLPLVLNDLYDKSQLKSMLTMKGVVSSVWIHNARRLRLDETEKLWSIIKDGLEMDGIHLRNYLVWKDESKYNALCRSAYNQDPEVMEFIWELAGELMDDDEDRKRWLFDSFDCVVLTESYAKFSHWSFHKFLAKRVNSGLLSGDEILRLLKSKDFTKRCYILQGYPLGLFTHALPVYQCIDFTPLEEEMLGLNFFSNLVSCLSDHPRHPLNEDLKEMVDKVFKEVTSRDRYSLADELKVHDCGFVVGMEIGGSEVHEDRFKFFIAAVFKQVHFCRNHFKKDGLVKSLMDRQTIQCTEFSILHVVIRLQSALLLGYVFIVLLDCLPRDDILGVLLQPYGDGKTVFHCAWHETDSSVAVWKKLNDVIVALLGKDVESAAQNEKIVRCDMPDSRDALEEMLTEWRRIWKKRQNEEKVIGEIPDSKLSLNQA